MELQATFLARLRYRFADIPEAVAFVSLLALFIFFSIAADNFLTPLSLANILTFASITGIVVIGVSILMIAGEFDLSVGSNFAVASYVFVLSLKAGANPILCMLLALLVSTGFGLINGLIVTRTGIPSFITTLGTMLAYRGIARALWADVEVFDWEGPANLPTSPLIPAPFARIKSQLEAVSPYVDVVTVYQYQGLFSQPGSKAPSDHPGAERLYRDYVSWLKSEHPALSK